MKEYWALSLAALLTGGSMFGLVKFVIFSDPLGVTLSAPATRSLDVVLKCNGDRSPFEFILQYQMETDPENSRVRVDFAIGGGDFDRAEFGCYEVEITADRFRVPSVEASALIAEKVFSVIPGCRNEAGDDLAGGLFERCKIDIPNEALSFERLTIEFLDAHVMDRLIGDRFGTDLTIGLGILLLDEPLILGTEPFIDLHISKGYRTTIFQPELTQHNFSKEDDFLPIRSGEFEARTSRSLKFQSNYMVDIDIELEDVRARRVRDAWIIILSTLLGVGISSLFEVIWARLRPS